MQLSTTQRRVILYARTSRDRNQGTSVRDQLDHLQKWAASNDRQIVAVYRDDDRSASRYAAINGRRPRDGWPQVMEALSNRQADELAVWNISRSTRDRAVWAALVAVCIEKEVYLAVDGKVHDPNDPDDGFMLDLQAALAVRGAAEISKNTKLATEGRAMAGKPHGGLNYGYERVIDMKTGKTIGRVEHPEQGKVVREAARRLLLGEPAYSIAQNLNERGLFTAHGHRWTGNMLSKMLVKPAYAGLRVYEKKVLDGVVGQWPALISREDHDTLTTMFSDPSRDKWRKGSVVKHLGSGIYRCGREECGGTMRVATPPSPKPRYYDCRTCHRVGRNQKSVDDLVEDTMIWRLSQPDVLAHLMTTDTTDVEKTKNEIKRLRGKLTKARAAWDDDKLSLEAYSEMEQRTLPKIKALEKMIRPKDLPASIQRAAGPQAEHVWRTQLTVTEKREIISALVTVTILPAGRWARAFDPDLIMVKKREI